MGFSNERIRMKHDRDYDHHYDNNHSGYGRSYHHGNTGQAFLMHLAETIIKNKTLLIALIIASVVIVTLGILMLVKLMPWLLSLFGYVEQSGVKGVVDMLLRIMRSIWEGSGKG